MQNAYTQAGTWTWIHGPQLATNPNGNYGTKGVEDITNIPPARYQAAYWKDLNGDFWVFGGYRYSTSTTYNDLWRFRTSTAMWTWINGPQNATNNNGTLGTQGIPSPLNCPEARGWGANCWTGLDGFLYLYGGYGVSTIGDKVWRYNVTTNEWTWLNGSNNGSAIFGIKNVEDSTNTPGLKNECKSGYVINNTLWLFGGVESGGFGGKNDVWRYNLANNRWTWVAGNGTTLIAADFGTLGIEATTNNPPGRFSYTKWKDGTNNFYIFAGGDVGTGTYNDVWKFNTSNHLWTWIGGTQTPNDLGNVSTHCEEKSTYIPRARIENQTAQTSSPCASANWSFGGFTISGNSSYNDLWIFNSTNFEWTLVSGSVSQVALSPNYGSIGFSNTSNMIPARGGHCIWTDNQENLWVFGGADFSGSPLILFNDMWKFTPDTNCYNIIQANSAFTWPNNFTICRGEYATFYFPPRTHLTIIPSANTSYDSITGLLTLSPGISSSFVVTAISSPGQPCSFNETKTITVDVNPKPNADFEWSLTGNESEIATTNISTNAQSYQWFIQNILYSTSNDITYSMNETEQTCLKLNAINSCGIDSMTKCYDPVHAYMPNVFSPNGDNINDIFRIIYSGTLNLLDFSVYDRWGKRIFRTNNPQQGWNGSFKNEVCEIGTYFYCVQIKREGLENVILKGDVTLTR